MKKIIFLLLIVPTLLFGQEWERTYAKGNGQSVQQTNDGGYIITGSDGIDKVVLIKTDSYGDTLWTRNYGDNDYQSGQSVVQTTDGGYIVLGYIQSIGPYSDFYLIRTDSNGDTLWTKAFGGSGPEYGMCIQQTTDGGFIITGSSAPNNGYYVIALQKLDENGNIIWNRNFSGPRHNFGKTVQQTTDGGFFITGGTTMENNNIYPILIKTDENGYKIWGKIYETLAYTSSGIQTNDGGFIVTGSTFSIGFGQNVFLLKTDENGDSLWMKTFGGIDYDGGNFVQQLLDEGYIITGYKNQSGSQNSSLYLIKTDSNGDTLWTRTYGENGTGESIRQTIDGGYIITGKTNVGGEDYIYLVKTDINGTLVSISEIPILNPNRKLIKTVDLSGKQINEPQKNRPYIEIYNDGTTQKKVIIK